MACILSAREKEQMLSNYSDALMIVWTACLYAASKTPTSPLRKWRADWQQPVIVLFISPVGVVAPICTCSLFCLFFKLLFVFEVTACPCPKLSANLDWTPHPPLHNTTGYIQVWCQSRPHQIKVWSFWFFPVPIDMRQLEHSEPCRDLLVISCSLTSGSTL